MKFTAEFDSVNSADIAAAAIRKNISPFSDISVRSDRKSDPSREKGGFLMYDAYNGTNYAPPVYGHAVLTDDFTDRNETDLRSSATLEVVCRSEDKNKVSRLIVGYGGRDIRAE